MLTTDEAEAMRIIFDKSILAVMNEQMNRTVMTQIVATGTYRVVNEVFTKVVEKFIVDETDDGQVEKPGGDGLDNLSDIIETDDQSNIESDDDGKTTEAITEEQPEATG